MRVLIPGIRTHAQWYVAGSSSKVGNVCPSYLLSSRPLDFLLGLLWVRCLIPPELSLVSVMACVSSVLQVVRFLNPPDSFGLSPLGRSGHVVGSVGVVTYTEVVV
jgi:hypothetical protein